MLCTFFKATFMTGGEGMSAQAAYYCEECNRRVVCQPDAPVPDCCGRAMSEVQEDKLPHCTVAAHPEMRRDDDADGPCDEGRGGV